MAATKEEIKELAEHIYDLDAEVYVHLGSSLGRVFNRDRERCVNELTELLTTRPQGHLVRSELGLIANMARTIEDKEERAMCMTEYNRILNEVMSLPTSFASGDVIDPILAKLNSFNVANRFSNDDHLIICISWTYGSGGIDVGFKLADKLHINYYDADIFAAVLKRLDAEKDKTIRDAAGYAHVSEELQQVPDRDPDRFPVFFAHETLLSCGYADRPPITIPHMFLFFLNPAICRTYRSRKYNIFTISCKVMPCVHRTYGRSSVTVHALRKQ